MKTITRVDAIQATQRLLQTEDGQIMMAHLLHKFGFLRKPTVGATPYDTYFNEGQRSVILEIGFLQDADPLRVKELDELNGGTDARSHE